METESQAPVPNRPRRRKKAWSHSEGPYGNRVRLFEDPNSGIIYAETRDRTRPGRYISTSLKHRDRKRAIQWAKGQVKGFLTADGVGSAPSPTASYVFGLYAKHQTPTKTKSEQDADKRRRAMWLRVLGASKDLSKLSLRDWQGFIDGRRSGAIDPRLKTETLRKPTPVREGTVAADLVFLLSVLNWAVKWREDDRYVMDENPARGFAVPHERNPRRPVVTDERFQLVRAGANQVKMVIGFGKKRREEPSHLPELLDLSWGTGRRISAILALRYQDLILTPTKGAPKGSIRWPASTDKMKKEWIAPMGADVRAAVDRILAQRPGIGAGFLFPAPNHPKEHVRQEVASAWLIKAERLAGVPKHEGSLWHAYRRGWATSRKWMPAVDVAAAGGWSDLTTLTTVYQQADMETMYRVVSAPSKLMERAGA